MRDDIFSVALALGAESVAELPRSESWLVEVLTDAGDRAPRRGLTVGVVGGSGGAGATTFACALGQIGAGQIGAVGASRSARPAAGRSSALVVDLDPLGPGLDRVLGVELHDGIRWDALLETTGRLSARSLHDAVPRRDGLGILTWASGPAGTLQAFAVREALSAAQRGHDLVVVDLPRTVDALFAEVVARCDLLVVVTRPTVAGVAATARLRARLSRSGPTRLLVRGHGVPVREVEQATGLPGAWTMGEQRGLAEAIDLGLGPVRSRRGPLARAATEALAELARAGRRTPPRSGRVSALPAGVVDAVRARLSREQGDLTPARVAAALREEGRPVGDATVLAVHDALRGDILGAGLLDPLVRMPGVTDVLVNGPGHVYVDRGAGLERTQVRFADDEAVRRLAQRLAAAGGRRLDDATPYVDVRLPDGTRLHAVLAPIARRGTCVSLRVPTRTAFSLDDLVRMGSVDQAGARLLSDLVAARLAFLVSGGTGSGKTTLLATLLGLVEPVERLVLVEDSAELARTIRTW